MVARRTAHGTYVYDVARPGQQHKDRYSSIAMGVKYITELEEVLRRKYQQRMNGYCIGVVDNFR